MFNNIKKHKIVISVFLTLFAFSLIFVGGSFSFNSSVEKIAEYATSVVKNNTVNKRYCCISAQKTSNSGPLPDSDSEFHNLYGVFRQEKITFASTINTHKEHNIFINNHDSESLSMLYVGPTGTIDYKGHYKHYTYPMEVMFEDGDYLDTSKFIVYISEKQADSILKSIYPEKETYSSDDYHSLLNKKIPFIIDGSSHDFVIQNIYLETNYYYEGLSEIVGEFVMTSYFLPNDLRSEQCNIYFFSEYTYQNEYFMNYVDRVYSSNEFSFRVVHRNIINDINDKHLLSFYYSKSARNLNWLNIMFVVFAIFCLLVPLYIFVKAKCTYLNALSIICCSLIPYLLFKAISYLSNNVKVFSETATKNNLIILIVFSLLLLLTPFIKSENAQKNKKKVSRGDYYELDI